MPPDTAPLLTPNSGPTTQGMLYPSGPAVRPFLAPGSHSLSGRTEPNVQGPDLAQHAVHLSRCAASHLR